MASRSPQLIELGWKPFFSTQISKEEADLYCPVRVMAVHRGKLAVAGAGIESFVPSRVPGADAEEDRPAVGDWLLLDRETLAPMRLLHRASVFTRVAAGGRQKLQNIAANVDTLFIVASCNQDFNTARLERYLVLAREVAVMPVIVLTKLDLTDRPEAFAERARALQPDVVVETVNARDADSVARLATWCGPGQTVALLGSSGVGKSTLVNTLRGSDSLATQAVREDDGKGRHTTTVREMHRLEGGGWLLDTPGMRELQLSEVASGLAEVFDDIIQLAQQCRFSNCTHEREPGCQVQAAMNHGNLDHARLERWRKLVSEDAANSASRPTRRERAGKAAHAPSKNPGKMPRP
ncbi:MAG: ribosome small subunit-dependent GTPase A [Pseudomonadota bacterium]